MTDDPTTSPAASLTKANITGKVPKEFKRSISPYRGKKRKPVKMSSDKRRHVNSLMKRGAISPKAASHNGLKP